LDATSLELRIQHINEPITDVADGVGNEVNAPREVAIIDEPNSSLVCIGQWRSICAEPNQELPPQRRPAGRIVQ
jgi:hypothetical protein